MGDKFNLSGDFRGAIVNVKSTLRNVHQAAGMIPDASDDEGKQLQELITRLTAELEKVPPAQIEEVEAVAISASTLVEQAKSGKKNKTLLKISSEGLKRAADGLVPVIPSLLPIILEMIHSVTRLSGG